MSSSMMESEEVINYSVGEDVQKGHLHVVKLKIPDDKMKIENCNKNYELLGSVTTENSPGVRTSARVIQKMKENSCRPTTPPPNEKELKLKEEKALQKTPSQQKPARVIWTNLERNFFFDALNEFGKDFESISNYINAKLKRKNITDQCFKTKEQIRTIYYQTFHKLSSKYMKFSDDVKKPIQELYALINYGEMRRKLQFVSEKNCMKIKDLVYKGYVTVRSKGKNIRVKTPSCKALRKLNQFEDWLEDIKLPPKVEVCLRPASMEAWARVQNIAQNPVIRTSVPLQKKLINVIKTFQHKWRSRETNMIFEASKIVHSNLNLVNNTNNNDNQPKTDQTTPTPTPTTIKNSHQIIETEPNSRQEPLFCLKPLPDTIIHRPLVSITELLSSFNICLNSYEERIGVKIRGETLCHDKFAHKRQRSDSGCEKKSPELKKIKNETLQQNNQILEDEQKPKIEILQDDFKLLKTEITTNDCNIDNYLPESFLEILCDNDNNNIDLNEITKFDETQLNHQDIINNDIDCNKINDNNNKKITNDIEQQKIRKPKCYRKREIKKEIHNLRTLVSDDCIKKIRKGWTILNAGDITIGDLYIVFGHDLKLIFEYNWLDEKNNIVNDKSPTIFATGMVQFNNLTTTSDSEKEQKQQINTINKIRDSLLGNKLKQLLLIANLSDRMKRKSCACGHSCDNRMGKTRMDCDMANRSFVANKPPYPSNNNNNNNNDSVFRQPLAPFRKSVLTFDSLKQIANNLRLKNSHVIRGGLSGSRQLIVQRLLPVQPGLNQSYDVVEVKNLQNNFTENLRKQSLKENDKFIKNTSPPPPQPLQPQPLRETENQTKGIQVDIFVENDNKLTNSEQQIGLKVSQNSTTIKNINDYNNDEPDLSALMELSLPSPLPVNKFLDENTNDNSFISIPSMSPMHLLRENTSDSRWLEENFNDFSLSSLLGHLDEVNNGRDITNMDSTNISSNMSVISETSVDYMSKFAEIAASMQNDDKDF